MRFIKCQHQPTHLIYFTSSSSELHVLSSTKEVVPSVMSSLPTADRLDNWSICSAALLRKKGFKNDFSLCARSRLNVIKQHWEVVSDATELVKLGWQLTQGVHSYQTFFN